MGPILIVDDNESVRIGLCQLLQDSGYSCEEVENGVSALEWVLSHEVDLVITDYQMPFMNGLELLESLRTGPFFNSPQVIFMTGNPSEALQIKARQAGACAVVLKPYDTNELLGAVYGALAAMRREKSLCKFWCSLNTRREGMATLSKNPGT